MTDKGREDVMIYRDLGSTGEKVSLIGIGGWHLGLKHVTEKNRAADNGRVARARRHAF